MFAKLAAAIAVIGISATGVPAVAAESSVATNPIFGKAAVERTTEADNKQIAGKGYYADYYGSYGIEYANYAVFAGTQGDYADAADYAWTAYQYFDNASYYSSLGW